MRNVVMSGVLVVLAIVLMWATGCGREEPGAKVTSTPRESQPPPAPPQPVDTPAGEVASAPIERPGSTGVQPTGPPPATVDRSQLPPVPPARTLDADPKVAMFAGLTGPKPATWIAHPPQRQFSIAEYAVPGREGGDQARIDVFVAGGSIQLNIDRWKTQFRSAEGGAVEPVVTELEADGMPITLVEFVGEYKGMGSFNFAPDQVFLCAILEAPAGQVFIRFVGPRVTVESYREDYMHMIRNLRRVEAEK